MVDEFGLRGSGKSRDTFLFAAAIQHGVLVLTGDRAFQRKCERVAANAAREYPKGNALLRAASHKEARS